MLRLAMRKHPIAEFMEANGIETQAEAARVLGLRDQQEVSDYVTWRHVPRPKKMHALATLLRCPLASLIPDADREAADDAGLAGNPREGVA